MMHRNAFIRKIPIFVIYCLLISPPDPAYAQTELIVPGGDWYDTKGNLIAATEGGIIKVGELYYLWGMDRSANNYAFTGINLYSSSDLKSWTFVNKILKNTSHPDLNNNSVVERAKILHNQKTGQFVIWMHYEGQNAYKTAEVGYATCNTIGGDYTFISHFRPMNIDSRDINVYQDDDGKAYLICTTQGNQSVSLFELDEKYTGIVREVYRGSASNDMECEGHAIIKSGGYYFWLMSWCTGWDFNDNHYFYAKSLAGPWTAGGNIAIANTHTYESQVGFAVKVAGSDTTSFYYTGDRWSVNNFSMSRIVLLPIVVNGTKLSVPWHDQWNIDVQTGKWSPGAANFIDGAYTITAKHSGLVLGTNGSAIQQQSNTNAQTQTWRIQNLGASHFKISSVASGKVMDVSGASREAGAKIIQYAWSDAYNQKWQIHDCGNGYFRIVSVNTLGKALEIENSSKNSGADVVLSDFAYKDNQMWKLTAVNSGLVSGAYYMIVNHTSEKALTDTGGADRSGNLTQITVNTNDPGQIWKIEDQYNGYYRITTVQGQKAVDNLSVTDNGSEIGCGLVSKRYSQQWQIVPVEDGYFKLINRISGKTIDNKDGSKDDGTPIIQYTDYAATNNNQQWRFVPADVTTVNKPDNDSRARELRQHSSRGKGIIVYDLFGRKLDTESFMTGVYSRRTKNNGVYIIKSLQKNTLSRNIYIE